MLGKKRFQPIPGDSALIRLKPSCITTTLVCISILCLRFPVSYVKVLKTCFCNRINGVDSVGIGPTYLVSDKFAVPCYPVYENFNVRGIRARIESYGLEPVPRRVVLRARLPTRFIVGNVAPSFHCFRFRKGKRANICQTTSRTSTQRLNTLGRVSQGTRAVTFLARGRASLPRIPHSTEYLRHVRIAPDSELFPTLVAYRESRDEIIHRTRRNESENERCAMGESKIHDRLDETSRSN